MWRSWQGRAEVVGGSMEPTLLDGDWLLVDPEGYAQRNPVAGDLVLAPDPREPARLLIKRVGQVDPEGQLWLVGDAPLASTDSRTFGSVDLASVQGRPWFRYWPIRRIGRIGRDHARRSARP